MKYKFVCLLIFAAGIFFYSSCKKSVLKVVEDNSIPIHNCSGDTTGISYLCFDSLITDSRCPMSPNVECIWQGAAIVQVTFHENEHSHTFKMSLKGFPSLGSPSDTTINGNRIIFTDLKPYPQINKPAPNEKDIKATFSITR